MTKILAALLSIGFVFTCMILLAETHPREEKPPEVERNCWIRRPQLELKISQIAPPQRQSASPPYIKVEFSNVSDDTIKIMKPVDGSMHCWVRPFYKFTVTDGDKNALKLSPRCGVCGFYGQDPATYAVEIKPHEKVSVEQYLPFHLPKPGEYTVSLEYSYTFDEKEKQPVKTPFDQSKPVAGVWQGKLQSNPMKIILPDVKSRCDG